MQTPPEAPWRPTRKVARGNAAEQILDDLRAQILNGQLPRGAKLPTEKQLAESYGVSGPTVREAIRGLTTAHLVEVRHGSGAYVTADADQLIGVPLISMIQLERVSIGEVLGVLSALMALAAEQAATRATEADVAVLRGSLDQISGGPDAATISQGLHSFIDGLAGASGNGLLAALCRFLGGVQIGLARELISDSYEAWKKTTRVLAKDRQRLVDAIAARDRAEAREAARKYSEHSAKVITSLPHATDKVLSDPALASLIAPILQRR